MNRRMFLLIAFTSSLDRCFLVFTRARAFLSNHLRDDDSLELLASRLRSVARIDGDAPNDDTNGGGGGASSGG